MGHYDGVEERIAEERAQNNKIIKLLTPEEFAAAYMMAKMRHKQWEIDQAMKDIKYWHKKYMELNVEAKSKAVDVLYKDGDDYLHKVIHDKKVKAILFGDED